MSPATLRGPCTRRAGAVRSPDSPDFPNFAKDVTPAYESTATLKAQRPAITTSFSGLFGFTGEGQSWDKVMTFTRAGDSLKRADNEGSFLYKRCTA